jgi:cellulose synthase/poly-beta-1,6-N-acetylglucosamine synthase-like glycosyltransferase
VALIPAHNEESSVAGSIASVIGQVERVVVAADNCTDGTVEAARRAGAEVFETVGNVGYRAGALNQALWRVMPELDDSDLILAMDADTFVDPGLVRNAVGHFDRDGSLGAVAANHLIARWRTMLELLQVMEFERDRRYIGRKKGRVGAMSGMASVFSVKALRAVAEIHGTVYDEHNWTEDWKLTYSLKHAGFRCLRPQDCICRTIPVTKWWMLFRQRERWARGYFQTLSEFGVTRITAWPWFGELWGLVNTAVWAMWLVLVIQSSMTHGVHFPPWALVAGAILVTERTVAVRRAGWRAVLVSVTSVLEMAYGWWVAAATLAGIVKHLFRARGQWVPVKTRNEEAPWHTDKLAA